jgi:hypothetical protein
MQETIGNADTVETAKSSRLPYAPPRLTVHGTVQVLTQEGGIGGGSVSEVPDGR